MNSGGLEFAIFLLFIAGLFLLFFYFHNSTLKSMMVMVDRMTPGYIKESKAPIQAIPELPKEVKKEIGDISPDLMSEVNEKLSWLLQNGVKNPNFNDLIEVMKPENEGIS